LRERVFFDYQEWDVKCSKDGFQEASPTGEMDADGTGHADRIFVQVGERIECACGYKHQWGKEG